MNKIKYYILAILLLPVFYGLKAASDGEITGSKHFRLHYVINVETLDSSFVDNAERMQTIQEFLEEVKRDSLLTITGVDFRGTASPDGSYEFNVWLSENRLRTFKELINSYIDLPDSLIFSQSSEIPWDEFRKKVIEDEDVPRRTKVIEIIDEGPRLVEWYNNRHIDARLLKLRILEGGRVWDYLREPILRDLRYGDAIFYYKYLSPLIWPGSSLATSVLDEVPRLLPLPASPQYCQWTPRIYVKSNLMGWLTLSANLGLEFDLAPHWSLNIPVYYSCWDYIKSTIKFRNFTVQPEFRYWPRWKCGGGNDGFFLGAHFGMMYYNFAVDGPYRYQDRRGKTPALGGGLALGYRMPLSKNQRWHVEFSAGAGVYKLDYDVFENTPNYKEGQWVRRNKKTFYGLDQAAITFSYNFGLTKYTRTYGKGGAR